MRLSGNADRLALGSVPDGYYKPLVAERVDDSEAWSAYPPEETRCIGCAVDPAMLTIIATRARYAMEANVLLRKASSRLSGATRLKIGLQYDPRIALDVV